MFNFRYVVACFILFSTCTLYICRLNLSTAIVKMAKLDNQTADIIFSNVTTISPENENLKWSEKKQNIILGSFFWGYFALQAVGGSASEIFGPRLLCFLGLFVSGIINILTPVIVNWDDNAFIASRVVLGIFQATVYPSCYALAARWMPDNERSTVLAIISIGTCFGSMIASSLSGYLSDEIGWPWVFYSSGLVTMIFSVSYFVSIRNNPDEHCLVSEREFQYIKANIQNLRKGHYKRPPFPWKKVLTSPSFLSSIFVRFAVTWLFSIFTLKVPVYFEKVLKVSLKNNGYFSSAVYAANGLGHFIGGFTADWMVKRSLLSKTKIRVLFESFATFGAAICLVVITTLTNTNQAPIMILMVISSIAMGLQSGGEMPMYSDLSIEFAASLFGISNTFAMSTGFLTPLVIGIILDKDTENAKQQWTIIFYLTAVLNIVGGIVFAIFANSTCIDYDADVKKDEEYKKTKSNVSTISDCIHSKQ